MASMVPRRGSKPGSICLNRSPLGPLGRLPEPTSYFPVSMPSPSGEYAIKPMPRALQTSWISRCWGPMLMSENWTCRSMQTSQLSAVQEWHWSRPPCDCMSCIQSCTSSPSRAASLLSRAGIRNGNLCSSQVISKC